MKRILIVLPVFLIALHGCMVGPNIEKPVVESPDSYRYGGETGTTNDQGQDTVLNLNWWELFGDEYLRDMIDSALVHNRNVQIAASRIMEAQLVVGYNRADIWPSFGYEGIATRQDPDPLFQSNGPGNLFSFGPSVFWELDFWGKYRRATQAARAEMLATGYGHRTVQISLISGVAGLYFQLLDYHTRLEISRRTLASRQQSLWIIQQRFEKGIIPEIDLNQAQIQEAIAAASVPFYARLVAKTEHALSTLVGYNPGPVEYGPASGLIESPAIPTGIPSMLLERRPDILEAEQLFYAQTARIGVAQAMRFPSISLTAALGAATSDLSNLVSGESLVWSVAGGLTGPIFNFGKNKRRVEIERQRAEQYLLDYQETVLQSFREVEDALVEIETLREELEAVKRQVTAAVNAAMLSQARYDGGQTSYLEVLESERQRFNAELNLADTYQQHLNSYVKLYKALGGGWITPEEMNESEIQADQAGAE
jgi:multidrug efflux system outer membrane protein